MESKRHTLSITLTVHFLATKDTQIGLTEKLIGTRNAFFLGESQVVYTAVGHLAILHLNTLFVITTAW